MSFSPSLSLVLSHVTNLPFLYVYVRIKFRLHQRWTIYLISIFHFLIFSAFLIDLLYLSLRLFNIQKLAKRWTSRAVSVQSQNASKYFVCLYVAGSNFDDVDLTFYPFAFDKLSTNCGSSPEISGFVPRVENNILKFAKYFVNDFVFNTVAIYL